MVKHLVNEGQPHTDSEPVISRLACFDIEFQYGILKLIIK